MYSFTWLKSIVPSEFIPPQVTYKDYLDKKRLAEARKIHGFLNATSWQPDEVSLEFLNKVRSWGQRVSSLITKRDYQTGLACIEVSVLPEWAEKTGQPKNTKQVIYFPGWWLDV